MKRSSLNSNSIPIKLKPKIAQPLHKPKKPNILNENSNNNKFSLIKKNKPITTNAKIIVAPSAPKETIINHDTTSLSQEADKEEGQKENGVAAIESIPENTVVITELTSTSLTLPLPPMVEKSFQKSLNALSLSIVPIPNKNIVLHRQRQNLLKQNVEHKVEIKKDTVDVTSSSPPNKVAIIAPNNNTTTINRKKVVVPTPTNHNTVKINAPRFHTSNISAGLVKKSHHQPLVLSKVSKCPVGGTSGFSSSIVIRKKKIKFATPVEAVAKEKKEKDMIALLDSCKSYEDAPIWLCFRLWDYDENLRQLKKFIKLKNNTECVGDEMADMKKIFDFHGMNSCLDCFILDEECNMRNIGYIIDDDVLISFNNILPYMTQYFVDLRDRFYGQSPIQNALIRQWINYCVRNIRGRRVSEYMWDEMDGHVGVNGFFGGSYRTIADTLMYISLYNRIKRWEPRDFAKRYNISRWFRLMQMDDKLRGANHLIEINPCSEFHPNHPFDSIKPDILDLKKINKV